MIFEANFIKAQEKPIPMGRKLSICGRRPGQINFNELKCKTNARSRWKQAQDTQENAKALPEYAGMELGKPKAHWG